MADFALQQLRTWHRASYVNGHPQIPGRRADGARLAQTAAELRRRYAHLVTDEPPYAELLQQVDEVAADGIREALEWAHPH
eukprot:scaffold1470_cov118-Isochrysis_galbana.AAC.9